MATLRERAKEARDKAIAAQERDITDREERAKEQAIKSLKESAKHILEFDVVIAAAIQADEFGTAIWIGQTVIDGLVFQGKWDSFGVLLLKACQIPEHAVYHEIRNIVDLGSALAEGDICRLCLAPSRQQQPAAPKVLRGTTPYGNPSEEPEGQFFQCAIANELFRIAEALEEKFS